MTAKDFIEKKYLETKKLYSLPPVDRRWKAEVIKWMEEYKQRDEK